MGIPKVLNSSTRIMEHGVLCSHVQAFNVNILLISFTHSLLLQRGCLIYEPLDGIQFSPILEPSWYQSLTNFHNT